MTEIPNAFGGFAPFPNTIMIPTMGLQSDVIGFRFGFGYEKGKRTLRAMSNEQFNTLDEEAEQAIYKEHDTTAINFFEMEMIRWVELQKIIIEKSVEIEVMKANRTPSAFREMFEGFTKGFTKQQADDVGNFFASLADPVMKIMAFFTGHKSNPTTGKKPSDFLQPVPSVIPSFPSASAEPAPKSQTPFHPTNPAITPKISVGTRFERTLQQAQADTSRSRGTGIIKTQASKPKAGQTQKMERDRLKKQISTLTKSIAWLRGFGNKGHLINPKKSQLQKLQQVLANLLARYRW